MYATVKKGQTMHENSETRAAFCEWIEGFAPRLPEDTPEGRAIAASVRKCGDILPGECCNLLDIHQGSSYAAAARSLTKRWNAPDGPLDIGVPAGLSRPPQGLTA